MKKYFKIFIFIMIIFLNFNVFASTTNVTNSIKYTVDTAGGTYEGDEIYMGGYNGRFNVNTRYNGRLSYIKFYLSTSTFNASTNHRYTITLNMSTSDWRNHFMGPIVTEVNSDGSSQSHTLSVSNFRFVSMKQIKFDFTTDNSLPPYLSFTLYSTDYASTNSTAITGDTNWNLSSIIIDNNNSSSGSGSGSGSGGSFDDSGIINNANENTENIMNNANQNTSDIMNNANQNAEDIQNAIDDSFGNNCHQSNNIIDRVDNAFFRLGTNVSYSRGIVNLNGSVNTTGNLIGYNQSTSLSNSFPLVALNAGTYYFKVTKLSGSYTYGNSLSAIYLRNSSSGQLVEIPFSNNFTSNGSSFTLSEPTTVYLQWYFSRAGINFNNYSLGFSIVKGSSSIPFEQTGLVCSNKLDNITDNINSVGSNVINGINSATQSAIDNANQNKEDIIDNANQNAQDTQDTINNNFNDCHDSTNLFTHADTSFTRIGVNVNYSKGIFKFNGTTSSDGNVIGYPQSSSPSNAFSIGTFEPGTYSLDMNVIGGSLTSLTGDSIMYFRLLSNTSLFNTQIRGNTTYYGHVFTIDTQQQLFIQWYVNTSGWIFNNYEMQFQVVKGNQLLPFEPPGERICTNRIDTVNDSINSVNDSITNSNIENNIGNSFFGDFENEDFGLSQIITIPLTAIQRLTSSSCSSLNVPIPFTNSSVPLPCMTQIYEQNIPSVYNLWKIVSFGIIGYFICLDIFHIVKGFKDPESDKVEVLDL